MKYDYEFLRKCDGLLFLATFNEKTESGYIKVLPEGIRLCYGEYCDNPDTFNRGKTCTFDRSTSGIVPEDFTIIPRDPNVYVDFHPGDVLTFNEKNISIHFRMRGIVIGVDLYDGATIPFTCNELFEKGYRLVLTNVEKELIKKSKKNSESKEVSLKDGDFCYLKTSEGHEWLFIKMGSKKDSLAYAAISKEYGRFNYNCGILTVAQADDIKVIRKATDSEIKMMKQIFRKNNLYWNNDFNRLEPLFDYHEYCLVLVRNENEEPWSVKMFKEYTTGLLGTYYRVFPDKLFRQCLPLNKDTVSLAYKTDSLL